MAVIVEDGTLVTDANSFVTRAEYITYAASIGVTIANDAAADVELIKATQFIGAHEDRLIGYKISRDQSTAYPRSDLIIDGFSWGENEIPRQVILLQMATALDIHAGIDPYNPPANPERATRRERVEGAIEVEYFGTDGTTKMSRSSTSTALLKSLLKNSGLMLVRV